MWTKTTDLGEQVVLDDGSKFYRHLGKRGAFVYDTDSPNFKPEDYKLIEIKELPVWVLNLILKELQDAKINTKYYRTMSKYYEDKLKKCEGDKTQ